MHTSVRTDTAQHQHCRQHPIMHTNCPCTPTYIWHTHMTCAATFNTLLRFLVPNATAAAQHACARATINTVPPCAQHNNSSSSPGPLLLQCRPAGWCALPLVRPLTAGSAAPGVIRAARARPAATGLSCNSSLVLQEVQPSQAGQAHGATWGGSDLEACSSLVAGCVVARLAAADLVRALEVRDVAAAAADSVVAATAHHCVGKLAGHVAVALVARAVAVAVRTLPCILTAVVMLSAALLQQCCLRAAALRAASALVCGHHHAPALMPALLVVAARWAAAVGARGCALQVLLVQGGREVGGKHDILHLQLTAHGAVAAVGVHELPAVDRAARRRHHALGGPGLGPWTQEEDLCPVDDVVLDA